MKSFVQKSAIVTATAILFAASSHATTTPPVSKTVVTAPAAITAASGPGIRVLVSVDWEGRELSSTNLTAMANFRKAFPTIPLVQFLNAAYYTKPGASASTVTSAIKRGLLPIDELGLHIHGWKSLAEAANVPFRKSPTFWGEPLDETDCGYDCGHEINISAYTTTELRTLMAFSVNKLEQNGLGHAISFRTGGWMGASNVRSALVAQGFKYDHSAVATNYLTNELAGLPILTWAQGLWPSVTKSTQPYTISTTYGPLIEIADNGALADYVTAAEMTAVFDAAVAAYKKDPSKPQVVSIGFHQETAATYLSRVSGALKNFISRAKTAGVPLSFVTSAGAVK
jgi:hypothetical protein